ncbi:hypothetical protein DEO72_LG3g1560 [Vigna unguiculata]|uniref:Uncharacterized protein n=1 Tax=Vigna unguiculata TaxID=3917 RepID=A0A4D6LEJ0_VIGUN|nr:hypothetical protein DEO72_LG3g1560 [Vigna unguiculata]
MTATPRQPPLTPATTVPPQICSRTIFDHREAPHTAAPRRSCNAPPRIFLHIPEYEAATIKTTAAPHAGNNTSTPPLHLQRASNLRHREPPSSSAPADLRQPSLSPFAPIDPPFQSCIAPPWKRELALVASAPVRNTSVPQPRTCSERASIAIPPLTLHQPTAGKRSNVSTRSNQHHSFKPPWKPQSTTSIA